MENVDWRTVSGWRSWFCKFAPPQAVTLTDYPFEYVGDLEGVGDVCLGGRF